MSLTEKGIYKLISGEAKMAKKSAISQTTTSEKKEFWTQLKITDHINKLQKKSWELCHFKQKLGYQTILGTWFLKKATEGSCSSNSNNTLRQHCQLQA